MHTNNTAHYNLPQFIGSDIPNPLTDWNDSMQAIDTAMYEIKTQADEIGSDIVDDEVDISDLQSQANLTDDNITLLNQQTTAARTAATDAQDAANRNASNIATLQQSVANNRTSITQYNNRFNQNVPFAFGIEEIEDPDNPGQMIDAYGFYTNDEPSVFVPFGSAFAFNAYNINGNHYSGDTSGIITIDHSTTNLNFPLLVIVSRLGGSSQADFNLTGVTNGTATELISNASVDNSTGNRFKIFQIDATNKNADVVVDMRSATYTMNMYVISIPA